MRIAIEATPGNLSDGPLSEGRGESRYAQSLAIVLAAAGHDVTLFGHTPRWGVCPRLPRLQMGQLTETGVVAADDGVVREVEVLLFTASPWHDPKSAYLDRRMTVLATFGDPAHINAPAGFFNRVARPWLHESASGTHFLPFPFFPLRWAVPFPSVSERRGFVWASKAHAAADPATKQWTRIIQDHIEANAPEYRLWGFAGIRFANLLELRADLARSVAFIAPPPSNGSVHLDALVEGCICLPWAGSHVIDAATRAVDNGLILDPTSPDPRRFAEVVDTLVHDTRLREDVLSHCDATLRDHSPEAVAVAWDRLVGEP